MKRAEWLATFAKNPCAINARKTHCIRGHLLPVAKNKDGCRRCNQCRKLNGWK